MKKFELKHFLRNKWTIISIIVLLFVVTNPTMDNFKDFLPKKGGVISRTNNFFLFSIYSVKYPTIKNNRTRSFSGGSSSDSNTYTNSDTYIGIGKNFIKF